MCCHLVFEKATSPHHNPTWCYRVMIWGCFRATGPGHPAVFESTMNPPCTKAIESEIRSHFLTANAWLKLSHATSNDHKHSSKLQQTVSEKEQLRCNSPKSKPKQLKCYSGTLREFWINKYPRTSINLTTL